MRPSSVARCACGARWHQIASRTSHCASCHETFSSEWAWEEHRTGPHPRTCLAPSLRTRKDGTPALRVKVDREGCAVWTPPNDFDHSSLRQDAPAHSP